MFGKQGLKPAVFGVQKTFIPFMRTILTFPGSL